MTTTIKCKLNAISAPTVNDDITLGYVTGSLWHDVSNFNSYVCLDNTDGVAVWKLITSTDIITESLDGLIEEPEEKTYTRVLAAPCAGTITSVKTKCASGTCTLTVYINSTPLGGTANSVSSTLDSQAHSSYNVFDVGDTIKMVVSSNSDCVDMECSIIYERALS